MASDGAQWRGGWSDALRCAGAFAVGASALPVPAALVVVCVAGGFAGAVLGSYAGRWEQCALCACKLPVLLLLAPTICTPAFLCANVVMGLRQDLRAVARAALAAVAAFALTLASLAPVLLLLYATIRDYGLARVASGLCFLLACGPAQHVFAVHCRPLVARDPRHRRAVAVWLVLYGFVTVQLAWLLRPFLGAPGLPVSLFRDDAFGNAYVEIGTIVLQWLRGG